MLVKNIGSMTIFSDTRDLRMNHDFEKAIHFERY